MIVGIECTDTTELINIPYILRVVTWAYPVNRLAKICSVKWTRKRITKVNLCASSWIQINPMVAAHIHEGFKETPAPETDVFLQHDIAKCKRGCRTLDIVTVQVSLSFHI